MNTGCRTAVISNKIHKLFQLKLREKSLCLAITDS